MKPWTEARRRAHGKAIAKGIAAKKREVKEPPLVKKPPLDMITNQIVVAAEDLFESRKDAPIVALSDEEIELFRLILKLRWTRRKEASK